MGIDQFPAGGQIEDILENAGQRIQDAYGNYLAQIRDANGNFQLAIVGTGGTGRLRTAADVLTSLQNKLGAGGMQALQGWASKNLNNFAYRPLTGQAAIDEILKDLDNALVGKTILETLEDAQGRLSVVTSESGQVTNNLYTLQKNHQGKYVIDFYNRAYNPNANPGYVVPISSNRLVPDYDNTSYLDIDYQRVIRQINHNLPSSQPAVKGMRIKMTRGNRPADYSAANTEMGKYIPNYQKPSNYTWHHLDDLEIDANGDAWCTMQLVETTVHSAAGMRHSGAVAQLEKYYQP